MHLPARPLKEVEQTLRATSLFGGVDASSLTKFAQAATRHQFPRGARLWHAASLATSFTIIAEGLVKIVRAGPDGTDSIVGLFGPRQSIGDTATIQRSSYPADAIAASELVEVLLVDAGRVFEAMAQNPAIASSLSAGLIEHSQALQQKIWIMTAGAVPQRLAALLLHLEERFGHPTESGSHEIPIHLSRSELASLIGATVETTIRTMSRWQKEELVETSATGFLLRDRPRLRALVNAG